MSLGLLTTCGLTNGATYCWGAGWSGELGNGQWTAYSTPQAVLAFGDAVFTPAGDIDRKALGGIVFNDPARRKQLESFIHPKVRREVEAFFTRHTSDRLAVAVIPLLFESDLEKYYDVVWLVKATKDQQIDRLVATRGMTRAEALARINAQMPFEEKLKRAQGMPHAVIDNAGTKDQTEAQVRRLIR